jgi:hypothetical protein
MVGSTRQGRKSAPKTPRCDRFDRITDSRCLSTPPDG